MPGGARLAEDAWLTLVAGPAVVAIGLLSIASGVAYTGAGHYEDAYRRVGDRWKFQRRELFIYHWVPLEKGWA